MRLTRTTEIAISILLACAKSRKRIDTRQAAREARSTKDYTARVVLLLVREGWIETHRGRSGGLSLARASDTILLGDVIRRTQPSISVHCTSADGSNPGGRALASIMETASEAFLDLLDCYSIADLLPGSLMAPLASFAAPARKDIAGEKEIGPQNMLQPPKCCDQPHAIFAR